MSQAAILPRTPEWLEARRRCLTATDVAAILGLHPYRTVREVYLDKRGELPALPENAPMYWGNVLEPIIGAEWARRNGKEIVPGTFTLHPKEEIFGATPDFLVGDDAVLEVKTAGFNAGRNFGPSGSDEIPTQYLCQTLWQCFVTGRKKWRLAVLIAGQDYREYSGTADPELIRTMAHRARVFWGEYVASDNPPPISGHEPDSAGLLLKHPQDDGSEVRASYELEESVAALGHLRKKIAADELEAARLANVIKEFMGDASSLVSDEGRFTWRAQTRKTLDSKALAKTLEIPPDVLDAHTKTSTTRVFLTPWKSEKA